MFAPTAAQTYARIGLETGVVAANPHQLILMLYDGAVQAIGEAIDHASHGRIAEKGAALSRAIAIIDEGLKASLDQQRGGRIAGMLLELYDYMCRRLLVASARNETAGMHEVSRLLCEIRQSWAEIEAKPPVRQTFLQQAAA